jgi:mRNA interferase MazF
MKDYNKWNEVKKSLEKRKKDVKFNEREVWWCQIGANIGFEEDGKNEPFERPVLVLRKYNAQLFFGLPLTSIIKENKFHYVLTAKKVRGSVILSQGRILSSKRLNRKMYKIDYDIYLEIIAAHGKLFHKKSKPPLKARESQVPFGNLYDHYSKSKARSKVQRRKEAI